MATANMQMQAIKRLNDSFPQPTYGTAESRVQAFMVAMQPYADEIVAQAVTNLIAGTVAGHNPSYMPTSAQVGTECLRLANAKAESDERTKRYTYVALPEPERAPVTAESRAKVMAMVQNFKNHVQEFDANALSRNSDGGRTAESIQSDTNHRFAPDMAPEAAKSRLMKNNT